MAAPWWDSAYPPNDNRTSQRAPYNGAYYGNNFVPVAPPITVHPQANSHQRPTATPLQNPAWPAEMKQKIMRYLAKDGFSTVYQLAKSVKMSCANVRLFIDEHPESFMRAGQGVVATPEAMQVRHWCNSFVWLGTHALSSPCACPNPPMLSTLVGASQTRPMALHGAPCRRQAQAQPPARPRSWCAGCATSASPTPSTY